MQHATTCVHIGDSKCMYAYGLLVAHVFVFFASAACVRCVHVPICTPCPFLGMHLWLKLAHASFAAGLASSTSECALNHERKGVFCGIATMIMVLQANGKNPPTQTRNQIQDLAHKLIVVDAI